MKRAKYQSQISVKQDVGDEERIGFPDRMRGYSLNGDVECLPNTSLTKVKFLIANVEHD